MKVTNLVFWVQDATLSVKFYRKLGFDVASETERDTTVRLRDFDIMLVTMRDEEEFNSDSLAGSKGQGMYVYINVDDVDDKYVELTKLGITPRSKPRDWPWGNREFVVKDPDGYKLCFWQKSNPAR